jgi:hypothetical protein
MPPNQPPPTNEISPKLPHAKQIRAHSALFINGEIDRGGTQILELKASQQTRTRRHALKARYCLFVRRKRIAPMTMKRRFGNQTSKSG